MSAPMAAANDTLAAAISYADEGLAVFPLQPREKIPLPGSRGVREATCLHPRIDTWWAQHPERGIAIAGGGPARLIVLDVDGDPGRAALQRFGPLPPTRVALTPRGGEHLYYRLPKKYDINAIKNLVGKLGPKLDIRGVGGYVVAPPSAAPAGSIRPAYEWLDATAPIADLPDVLAEAIIALSAPKRSYAQAALERACAAIRSAAEGTRNDKLNREAYSLGGLVATGALDEATVRQSLVRAAVDARLGETESVKTVDSGLRAGRAAPRHAPIGGASTADDSDDWKRNLRFARRGEIAKDPHNATVLLTLCPEWRGTWAWEEFRGRVIWLRDAPDVWQQPGPRAGDPVTDEGVTWVQSALSVQAGVCFASDAIWSAINLAAREFVRNEVVEWLDGLTWDGTPRLDHWLHDYLDAEDSPHVGAVGRWWLIGAVARALRPGCQVDHVLVLEGLQGTGKSSVARALGGDWYLGSLPDLRDRKAAAEALDGKWIVEISELDALRGAASTRVKDFLSQTGDYYRPAYGRVAIERPRRCAFIGTTNDAQYLHDHTGARRYWPVRCGEIDVGRLSEARPQLFAEAAFRFRGGDQWWPDSDGSTHLASAQEERYQADEWETVLAAWKPRAPDEFGLGDALAALDVPTERWDRSTQTRAGIALARVGFAKFRARRHGRLTWLYRG